MSRDGGGISGRPRSDGRDIDGGDVDVDVDNLLSAILPGPLLAEILEWTGLRDGRRALQSCRALYDRTAAVEGHRRTARVETPMDAQFLCRGSAVLPNLLRLVRLDVGEFGCDAMMEAMEAHLPLLRDLLLVGSTRLTDRGVEGIAASALRCQGLRYVDLTNCARTTYYATLRLRRALRYPAAVIRRQPVWMDGHFATPFADDGAHTYYADGSFAFARHESNVGYVCEQWRWNAALHPEHCASLLQYANHVPPDSWPAWSTVFYRPGVSLLRCPDDSCSAAPSASGASDGVRSVLVAQALKGTFPPASWPKAEHASTLPVGVSAFFDQEDGTRLSDDEPRTDRTVMVTRMLVRPLAPPDAPSDRHGGRSYLMPPATVVDQIQAFFDRCPEATAAAEPAALAPPDSVAIDDARHRMFILHSALGGRLNELVSYAERGGSSAIDAVL